MSKRIKLMIICSECGHHYTDDFFRTIWGEHEAYRSMVMEDRVNVTTCPNCGHKFHVPLAMMYVDVQANFAVWWEPTHDPGIDSDAAAYAKMMGPDSYYAKAPRIADWEEFKKTINRYYSGEMVGGKITKMDPSSLFGHQRKSSGCLGTIILILAPLIGLFMALVS